MSSPTKTRGRSPAGKEKGDGSGSKSTDKSPRAPSRSPARRSRTRDARRIREVVVERIVREGGGSGNWPQLTRTNYYEWSLRMKLKLQARRLWEVIEDDEADFDQDRGALDAICSAVPGDMVPVLATKETAKDAWEAIQTLRIGDDRVWIATAQNLRAEYEGLAL